MNTVYIYSFTSKPKLIGEDEIILTEGVIVLDENFKPVETIDQRVQKIGEDKISAINSYDDVRKELFQYLDDLEDVTIKMGSHEIEIKVGKNPFSLKRVDPEIYKPGEYFENFISEGF